MRNVIEPRDCPAVGRVAEAASVGGCLDLSEGAHAHGVSAARQIVGMRRVKNDKRSDPGHFYGCRDAIRACQKMPKAHGLHEEVDAAEDENASVTHADKVWSVIGQTCASVNLTSLHFCAYSE